MEAINYLGAPNKALSCLSKSQERWWDNPGLDDDVSSDDKDVDVDDDHDANDDEGDDDDDDDGRGRRRRWRN